MPYLKDKFPNITLGAYVDYYTENTLKFFNFYDFVICNTRRHLQAMDFHKQKYYIPWGTDVELYKPRYEKHEQLTFFHSVGMSPRKGTDILVRAFIEGKCYEKSKLIIHTQIPIEKVCDYKKQDLLKYNVEIIEETVTAPGLYYKGDVYVYPTRLDGLGLTMYEALACGLPMITTDFPPMNEVGDESCVTRVKVKDFYCRSDAYYFPMALCDEDSLIQCMNYYISNRDKIDKYKKNARKFALDHYNIQKQSKNVADIFINSKSIPLNRELQKQCKKHSIESFNIVKWLANFSFIRKYFDILLMLHK